MSVDTYSIKCTCTLQFTKKTIIDRLRRTPVGPCAYTNLKCYAQLSEWTLTLAFWTKRIAL